jgi:hypothetical protein
LVPLSADAKRRIFYVEERAAMNVQIIENALSL